MKRTKSVLPTDIPYKLRQEFAVELATPLTNIFNACMESGIYPDIWKFKCINTCAQSSVSENNERSEKNLVYHKYCIVEYMA